MSLGYIEKRYKLPLKVSIAEITGIEYDIRFLLEKDALSLNPKSYAQTKNVDTIKAESNINSEYTFDTFVVGSNNRFAQNAALAVAESPGKAYNPLYYKNHLDQMSMQEVDSVYISYHRTNTETSFMSRELSLEEMGRRKALRKLYKNYGRLPEHSLSVIQEASAYNGEGVAFCSGNCTYYLPDADLSDEELLELIDFQIKVDYCWERIEDEIARGIRSDRPQIEYVKRERIETLDMSEDVAGGIQTDGATGQSATAGQEAVTVQGATILEAAMAQPWLQAYAEVLEGYFEGNKRLYDDSEKYYANICFIYLNEDEIPEMLFGHGNTEMDYDDHCNTRDYLYTYRDGQAVLLSSGEETIDDFYGYQKPFRYVEGKSKVYFDYYYIYDFSTYDNATDIIDSVWDEMSRIDTWDFDTLTRTSTKADIKLLHAVYNYVEEDYSDADFAYEYYVNVTDILRDEQTGGVTRIVGNKVDRKTYEACEEALWNGEEVTTLSVQDFDKIYCDYDVERALAKSFLSHLD